MFFTDDETEALPGIEDKKNYQRKTYEPVLREPLPVDLFTDDELMAAAHRETLIVDTECYRNYWLIAFKSIESGKVVYEEYSPDKTPNLAKIEWILWHFKTVSFNGNKYDLIMIALALAGLSPSELKDASDKIIKDEMRVSDIEDAYRVSVPPVDHIDLIEVCPLQGSLKTYAARLHAQRMQDLPYEPDLLLTRDQAAHICNYCINDLNNTGLIYLELRDQIKLRETLGKEYDQDLRSRSDAQIAEYVISAEVAKINGFHSKRAKVEAGKTFKYIPPDYLSYRTPVLQDLLTKLSNLDFTITETGKVVMDALKGLDITVGETVYRLGRGGLHSKEKSAAHIADDDTLIIDDDVESYYPKLIINSGLYPQSMGPTFLTVYQSLVDRRLAAKKAKNNIESDGLKITINGTFGKLGSRWSKMYAPNLLIQVTLTGQLALLMLIEMLELNGIPVISANTDGIVKKCRKDQYELLRSIIEEWEKRTGLRTEETRYSALYSRDINNYIAVKVADDKGKKSVKGKGIFANPWNDPKTAIFRFHKNPMATICIEALNEYILNGTAIDATIRQCGDIRKFVLVKKVKGGAEKDGVYLGGVIRWYYARNVNGVISYAMNGNKVSDSDGGKPCLDLPEAFPDDIDYERYVEITTEFLYAIGYAKKPGTQSTFF